MTVFKAVLKVLWQCKAVVLLYTICLVGFAAFQMQTEKQTSGFLADRPDILLINQDTETSVDNRLSEGLAAYLTKHCEVANIQGEDAISDALFYREISYIVKIPERYGEEFLAYAKGEAEQEPVLEIRSTGDQEAS